MKSQLCELTGLSRDAGGSTATSTRSDVPAPRFRWRTRVLLPGAILLTTAGLFATAARDVIQPAVEVRVVPVVVKSGVVAPAEGTVVVQAPGWVEADPFPTAVSALADGVVEEVLVLEGERVEAGQVVARLVDDDARIALIRASATLAEREAGLAAAQAALDEAQRNWDHPIELTRKLETARAQLAEKQAEFDRWPSELAREAAHGVYLNAEFERIAALKEHAQASDIEFVNARQAHEAQQAQVEAVRRQEAILKAQFAAILAEVQAAEEDLRLRIADTRALAEAKAEVARADAAVNMARAERDEAALRMERMQVRAPVGGIVMTRLAEPGSKLMLQMDDPRSAQVVRLYDPQRLQVRVDVPLVEAAKVGVGQRAMVIVDVLPDREFRGYVSRVVHEADVQKNTLQVKVAIENPVPAIKPEMLARAKFFAAAPSEAQESGDAGGTKDGTAILIPESAVSLQEGQSFVWLADQVENIARRRTIQTGAAAGDGFVLVVEGLRPGDRVIVDAPPNLSDGQRIRMIEAAPE